MSRIGRKPIPVPDTVTAQGGVPYVNRVGHAFMKIGMREHDAGDARQQQG